MAARRTGSILDNNAMVSEPREPRRTSFSYVIFSLFVTLLGLGVAIAGGLLYGQRQLEAPGPLTEARTAVVKSGQGGAEIAAMLAREGIISNQRVFHIASAIYHRLGRTLKAGEYSFEPGESMQAVFDKISEGKGVSHKVTVPEGWTTTQALERIRVNPVLTGDLPDDVAEGILLPDTYAFQRGDTRQSVVDRMRTAQVKLMQELWDKRAPNLPIKSIEEALILASIVEKETGVSSERARVAAVFINRLNKRMRLQSDPTIIYGIVGGKGKLGRPIRRSEIDAKTAYNTYQIDGLPPTPIANPGRKAIEAVLQPDETEELYFVADGTGGHVFAKTLAEHQVNVQNYRKIERAERAAAAAAAATAAADADKEQEQPEATAQPDQTAAAASGLKPSQTEPAASDTSNEAETPAGEELPLADVNKPSTSGEIAGRGTAKVPLPRPRPVIN